METYYREMYGFLDENNMIQFVPASCAEFISRKQYFTEILSGPGKYHK